MDKVSRDIIVVGAGHAGLSISYLLKQSGADHVVFEKGRIGDTWRNQRWNSFRLNTPNRVNLLPGQQNQFADPDGFCSTTEFVSCLEEYSRSFGLPVQENSEVMAVESVPGQKGFTVSVRNNGSVTAYRCEKLVVASGAQNKKLIPPVSGNISPSVLQLHACEYRNASSLPEGAVLVAGSGQSGVQIAEDLLSEGRQVFLSTSNVGRAPRRYRGTDIVDWLILTGFFDLAASEVTDPQILVQRQIQISGVGQGGHTLSIQSLARKGAVITGKIADASADSVLFYPDAATHVMFADETSQKIKMMIDQYIRMSHLEAPLPEEDPADLPDENASCVFGEESLSLSKNNIKTVIWATGFTGDFSYLKLPVFRQEGILQHMNGKSDVDGLYFIGLPWLRKRKSSIILGIREDAGLITDQLLKG